MMRSVPEFSASSSSGRAHTAAAAAAAPISGVQVQHSSWQSPVPYLFAGLAAMLGLIALALLVLACSYWKLSGYLEPDGAGNGADDGGKAGDEPKPKAFEEKVLVIMAGDRKPTFLATPVAGRAAASNPAGESSGDAFDEEKPPAGSSSIGGGTEAKACRPNHHMISSGSFWI